MIQIPKKENVEYFTKKHSNEFLISITIIETAHNSRKYWSSKCLRTIYMQLNQHSCHLCTRIINFITLRPRKQVQVIIWPSYRLRVMALWLLNNWAERQITFIELERTFYNQHITPLNLCRYKKINMALDLWYGFALKCFVQNRFSFKSIFRFSRK